MTQSKNQSNTESLQFEKNWEEFFRVHPFNYKNAEVKGKLFDNINSYQGKVYCFPVRTGCNIKDDDIILLDKYCEAFSLGDQSVTDEDMVYSELAGTALNVITLSNNQSIVFVRNNAVFKFKNTTDCKNKITEKDICNACYLESNDTVTRSELDYAFAGQIMDIENDIVTVFVNLEWRF